ncbi:hypothetical protein SDC9_87728 [bioreactor metagenome]|uniref:NAD-specific glutamate dehydrogenase n=1 Tax=bioreactor metagenome TaxID=1076179 RepID=A0A644ZL59_9ZZZZ
MVVGRGDFLNVVVAKLHAGEFHLAAIGVVGSRHALHKAVVGSVIQSEQAAGEGFVHLAGFLDFHIDLCKRVGNIHDVQGLIRLADGIAVVDRVDSVGGIDGQQIAVGRLGFLNLEDPCGQIVEKSFSVGIRFPLNIAQSLAACARVEFSFVLFNIAVCAVQEGEFRAGQVRGRGGAGVGRRGVRRFFNSDIIGVHPTDGGGRSHIDIGDFLPVLHRGVFQLNFVGDAVGGFVLFQRGVKLQEIGFAGGLGKIKGKKVIPAFAGIRIDVICARFRRFLRVQLLHGNGNFCAGLISVFVHVDFVELNGAVSEYWLTLVKGAFRPVDQLNLRVQGVRHLAVLQKGLGRVNDRFPRNDFVTDADGFLGDHGVFAGYRVGIRFGAAPGIFPRQRGRVGELVLLIRVPETAGVSDFPQEFVRHLCPEGDGELGGGGGGKSNFKALAFSLAGICLALGSGKDIIGIRRRKACVVNQLRFGGFRAAGLGLNFKLVGCINPQLQALRQLVRDSCARQGKLVAVGHHGPLNRTVGHIVAGAALFDHFQIKALCGGGFA